MLLVVAEEHRGHDRSSTTPQAGEGGRLGFKRVTR
jgi:hypothetical protein